MRPDLLDPRFPVTYVWRIVLGTALDGPRSHTLTLNDVQGVGLRQKTPAPVPGGTLGGETRRAYSKTNDPVNLFRPRGRGSDTATVDSWGSRQRGGGV